MELSIQPFYTEHGSSMAIVITMEDGTILTNEQLADALRDYADILDAGEVMDS